MGLQDNASNCTKEHASYRMLRRLFGNGLLTSEGSFWLRQRRLAQPAFHKERIAKMGATMTAASQATAARWQAEAAASPPGGDGTEAFASDLGPSPFEVRLPHVEVEAERQRGSILRPRAVD